MDLIAGILSALQAPIALALLFLLPGLALGPHFVPNASSPLSRLGRAAGVSLLTGAVACTLLAWSGTLRPTILAAVLIGLILLPFHSRRPNLRVRFSARGWRWRAVMAVGALLLIGLVVLSSRPDLSGARLPFTSTVWYYINLAREVADAGGLPTTTQEWGAARPFQLDYLPATAHTAGAIGLLPGPLLGALEIYRLAILILAGLFATLLFRRWVSSWMALLGACLLLATVRLQAKFLDYRPETWAFALALFALWLVDRALVERSRRLAVTAAIAAAIVFMAHAEVFLVFAPAVVGLAVARTVVAPGRGLRSSDLTATATEAETGEETKGQTEERRGWLPVAIGLTRPAGWRLRPAVTALAILVGGTGLAIVTSAVLTGDVRALGYAAGSSGGSAVASPFTRIDEVPPGWQSSGDPTWDFYIASVAPALAGTPPPSRFFDSRMLPRAIANVWPSLDGRTRSGLIVLVGLIGLAGMAWPFLDARRRRAILTWGVFGIGLFAGSIALFLIAGTYVPDRTGPRRLMPYELFIPVVAAVVALWTADRAARRGWRVLLPRRGPMLAAGVALAVLTAGAVSAAPPRPDGGDEEPESALSRVGYEAYRWIDTHVPLDSRVMTNAYTDGALAAVARRTGLLDGRAVYLEDREFLAETTTLLLGARVLFSNPDTAVADRYLARNAVDYLLVGTAGPNGSDLGGYVLFDTDVEALEGSDRYTLVESFGDGRLLLFEVVATR